MNKKIFAVALSLVMLFALAIPAFADTYNASVTASATTAKRGETVTFTVAFTDDFSSPALTVDFLGAWDTNVFEFVEGKWLLPQGTLADVSSAAAVIAYMAATDMKGDVFELTLKVKDDAAFGATEVKTPVTDSATSAHTFVVAGASVTITHDCVPAADYSKDADAHWKECTVPGCDKTPNKIPHTWTGCEETCPDCGETRTVTHTYNVPKSDAEYHWNECACGAQDTKEAHDFKEVVDPQFLAAKANCQSPAKYYKSCTCGAKSDVTFEDGAVDATVHANTEVKNAEPASCTKEGYTGDTYCKDENVKIADGTKIEKTAHTFGEWVVTKEATKDEEGSKERTCTVCKTEKEVAKIDKLPASTGVATGDTFNAVLWTVLTFASVAALATVVYFKKREGNRA